MENRPQSLPPWPVVTIHGLADARKVLSQGAHVILLSAPGAALAGGVLWWRAIIGHAAFDGIDILDCAASPGAAMAALRAGQRHVVLGPETPAWSRVDSAAAALGAVVLAMRPASLDLAHRGAQRLLAAHLTAHPAPDRAS